MAEKNRASVLAIVEETTAGELEMPSAGTQYLALQEGFTLSPNFEAQENTEIRASIGVSKLIQGLEQPEGSFDHYMRHSGVEGQAPNFGPLLKSLLGNRTVNASERLTAASSTVSLLKLASNGSEFPRGMGILGKDGTNGYFVRTSMGNTGNDVPLSFDLENAPAAGIGLGKCVNYAPANEGHPTLSIHLYRGNGGAYEAMAGARVASANFTVQAGDLINASYAFQGTKYFYNPIAIPAGKFIDFEDDDGAHTAPIPDGIYRTPVELAAAIQAAMRTVQAGETVSVVYQNSGANKGKFRISCTGTVFELQFATGTNAANQIDTLIGFTHADKTAATFYLSDSAVSLAAPHTPAYDNADPRVAKNNEVLLGDSDDTTCFCASSIDITVTLEIQNVECVCAESGVQEKIINRRTVELQVTGLLDRYDADKFDKFANNSDVRFQYAFGQRSPNWVPGTVCSIFIPTATISSHELGDNNGIVTMQIGVRPYVDNTGAGEFYINFL